MQPLAPQWLHGCRLRPCWFEPTFHKHSGKLCAGLQIHVEDGGLRPRGVSALARCRRSRSRRCAGCEPDYELWRDFPYEYERDRLAIDLINGSELLRGGSTIPSATPADLDALATADEDAWREEREAVLLYR